MTADLHTDWLCKIALVLNRNLKHIKQKFHIFLHATIIAYVVFEFDDYHRI